MSEENAPRTIVLTGGSGGIGRQAAGELARGGAQVIIVGRDPERTKATAEAIGGTAELCDLTRLDDVRTLAATLLERYPRIDVLANNAGGMNSKRALTVDGFERTLQVNHLAPFLLTRLLLPRIVESGGRVVSTSSAANLFGRVRLDDLNYATRPWWGGWGAYGAAKLLTNLFIHELARRSSVTAFAFHPGVVMTNFGRDSTTLRLVDTLTRGHYGIPVEAGAVPLIQLAGPTTFGVPSGTYFNQLAPDGPEAWQAKRVDLAEAVWERSSELVGVPSTVTG